IVLSFYRFIVLSFYRSIVLSFYRSIVLSFYRDNDLLNLRDAGLMGRCQGMGGCVGRGLPRPCGDELDFVDWGK
ncbi:MAG: hypothetical protein NC548_65285, partial [Lachnospiraceae bacterium]|nr:hypothetical protein [Lachnospiraceae bacterium]